MPSRAVPGAARSSVVVVCRRDHSLFTVLRDRSSRSARSSAAILGADYAPGLHFKWPVGQVVEVRAAHPARRPTRARPSSPTTTAVLIVDFYMKWRVKEPSRYFQATSGDEEIAGERLAEIVKDGIKSVVAQRTLQQIVTAERAAVTGDMFGSASRNGGRSRHAAGRRARAAHRPAGGGEHVACYESMKQNFAQGREPLRAEGSSSARAHPRRGRARAHRDHRRLPSAMRCSVRGDGRRGGRPTSMRGPTRAIPSSMRFYRSLQAYERSIGKEGDVLVVRPEGEFFKYLKDPEAAVRASHATSGAHRLRGCARRCARAIRGYAAVPATLAGVLFFVLEGYHSFLNPNGMKRGAREAPTLGDRELRIAGLGSMLVGSPSFHRALRHMKWASSSSSSARSGAMRARARSSIC